RGGPRSDSHDAQTHDGDCSIDGRQSHRRHLQVRPLRSAVMKWFRVINRLVMWFLIAAPVLLSGIGNLREQLGYGTGQPWNSLSDVVSGWGIWLVGVLIWVSVVRGISQWLDRKLAA